MASLTLSPGNGLAQQYNPSTGTWSNFTPTLSGGANTSAVTTPTLSSPSTNNGAGTSGAGTAAAGDALNSSLNSSFDTSQTASQIVGAYNAQQAANAAGAAAEATSLTDTGNANISYEEGQTQNTVNQATGNSKGGIINPGAFGVIQTQSNQQIKLLTQQMNDALANNQASLVTASANALAAETSNMAAARATFLSNYFNTQTEARSEASFQTPEQTQVLALSGQYPQAGITPTDTLAQAEAKVSGSAQYQLTQTATQAQITQALAAAAASGATAAQTNALTAFLHQGNVQSTDPNVQALVSNTATPQEIQDKYPTSLYGGYAAAIISAAQGLGYNLNTGTMTGVANNANANSIGGGGLSALGTAGTNLLGEAGSKIFGSTDTTTNPFSLTTPSSSGTTYKGFTLPY